MNRYTVEDIEFLCRKSGISYEEAVNLLDYHDGDMAKALVDLERNGKISPNAQRTYHHGRHDKRPEGKSKGHGFAQRLYQDRLKMTKGDVTVMNIPLLVALPAVVLAPWLSLTGFGLGCVMGCRIRVDRSASDFKGEDFTDAVKNAGRNVKEAFEGIARDLGADESPVVPKAERNADSQSYYGYKPSTPAPIMEIPDEDDTDEASE